MSAVRGQPSPWIVVAVGAPRLALAAGVLVLVGWSGGCSSPDATIALIGATTLVGGQSPAQEIEQVYYIGILDPEEQLPPAVYRITVRGQASALSFTRFASGWAPAAFVDTLNTSISFKEKGGLQIEDKSESDRGLETGRRLVMFGPEGFREAPKDHRLVIVMGSSPEKFFDAVGTGIATVAQVETAQTHDAARTIMLEELLRLQREQNTLKQVQADAAEAKKGVQ